MNLRIEDILWKIAFLSAEEKEYNRSDVLKNYPLKDNFI